jgi:hypothetical protein
MGGSHITVSMSDVMRPEALRQQLFDRLADCFVVLVPE